MGEGKKLNKNFKNSRKAIAPAIAVALLLAVTIALVAAVGYATSNVTPSAEAAPQGVFEVEIEKSGGGMGGGIIKVRQYSGDAIDTQNIKLKFVAKGAATEVVPTGNNTFYMAWNLYNPEGNENNTSPHYYKANPEGTEEFYYDSAADAYFPIDSGVTTVGVHIANQIGESWFGDIAEVKLFNKETETWVNVPVDEGSPIQHRDPWSAELLTYRNFTIANPDNNNFTLVQIKNDYGVTSTYDLTNPNFHSGDLNAGDAIFARMHEYNSPYRYSVAFAPTEDGETHFGSFGMTSGETMKAHGTTDTGVDAIHACMSNWDNVVAGDIVEVYIIYSSTNQVIWQGDVIVE
jgi:FlaG/FlaF family flagellin (archaellin)